VDAFKEPHVGVKGLMGGTCAQKRFCFSCNLFPCSSDGRLHSSQDWQLPRYLPFKGSL